MDTASSSKQSDVCTPITPGPASQTGRRFSSTLRRVVVATQSIEPSLSPSQSASRSDRYLTDGWNLI